MLFDWSTFFSMFLEHILSLFFNDPSLLLQDYKKRISLELGVFIFGGWMACFT
jgi:hypothetical protein